MTAALDVPPIVGEDGLWIDARSTARLASIDAYRSAALLFDDMARRLEADPIDAPAFLDVEARCVVELNRAQASINRLRDLFECRGEA